MTEEHPYAMIIPIEFFLMGFGYYRQQHFASSSSNGSNPTSPSCHSCIAPELLSPESLGVKLKPIKTRVDIEIWCRGLFEACIHCSRLLQSNLYGGLAVSIFTHIQPSRICNFFRIAYSLILLVGLGNWWSWLRECFSNLVVDNIRWKVELFFFWGNWWPWLECL